MVPFDFAQGKMGNSGLVFLELTYYDMPILPGN